jgi:16S rRNA (cytosine967-C5)-methyltransferase
VKAARAGSDPTNPRRAALDLLERLDRGPLDLSAGLDRALSKGQWDPRDRRLAAELTYGVARWRFRLDWVIRRATGRHAKDLDRRARTLLRLGVYQLAFTRVPAPAAVHSTVALAGGDAGRRGFVNAVLRALARDGVPEPPTDAKHFAVRHGLPDWLAARWLERLGPDGAEALARHANAHAPLTLRVNTTRIASEALSDRLEAAGLEVTPSAWAPDALRVAGHVPVREIPGFAEGLWYVQDEAGQMVARLVGARPGERVLDACAAPGGKATQLAAAVGDKGEVVAMEPAAGRLERLSANVLRLGAANVRVVRGDLGEGPPPGVDGTFDRVLVDAPCSGLGVLGRHPEGRWWKDPAGIRACAEVQGGILRRAARLVRPGGTLVYAVCTGEPEETTGVTGAFLADHPEFQAVPAASVLGATARPWTAPDGSFTTLGNAAGLDGFFALRMERAP